MVLQEMNTMIQYRTLPEGYFNIRWGPLEFTDWMQESMSWKENCSIGDWSFLWERWFKGKDAVRLISDLSVNSTKKWEVGQSKHTIHCNRDGKIIHEGIISRLGEDEYMVFGRGTFYLNYWYEKNRENYPDLATEPDDWFNIQVAGPNAIALLEKACGESLRDGRSAKACPENPASSCRAPSGGAKS
jgi:vanillate/3-O-methylgallate O-demethylase